MTDTDQLPPLPNTSKLFEDDNNIVLGYTVDQMHAYALQALAQVQDEAATIAVDHFDNAPNTEFTNRIYPPVRIGTKLYTTLQPVQTTQAEVTDDLVEKARVETFQKTGADLIPEVAATFARAILALRPAAVPMTGEEIREAEKRSYIDTRRPVFTDDCWGEEKVEYEPTKVFNFFMFARAIEAHHGITAKTEGGK